MELPAAAKTPSLAKSAFTLIEMLVVIGVIGILLVAVIPAVNSLSKSNGRKAAIGSLLGTIEQARAQAIKDGQATYLVFPTFAAANSNTDPYNYKSFAIYEDDPSNTTTPKQLTPWRTLPTGVSFRAVSTQGLTSPPLSLSTALTPPLTIVFTPATNANPSYYCIKFNTDGGMDNPTTDFTLAIFEGLVNGSTEVPTSNPLITETVTISHLTGRAQHNT